MNLSLGRTFSDLRRLGLRLFLALAALQAVVVGALVALDQLRKRREAPWGGFPWKDQHEVVLEGGDRLKLYPYGVQLYDAMLEDIRNAKKSIYVGTFIWKGDEVGRRFVEALAERAREGVNVCVIFDGLANVFVSSSSRTSRGDKHPALQAHLGAENLLNPRNVFRYHKHIMSVDGEIGFVGGYNIGSLYAEGWRDTHVRIEGPDAREIENDLVDFWNRHRPPHLPELELAGERAWNPATIFHRNDPT
jgi:cardiolipin synthase